MQYSNPWSCSMGGWLISSGFASAISLRLFDPTKPEIGQEELCLSVSREHGLLAARLSGW